MPPQPTSGRRYHPGPPPAGLRIGCGLELRALAPSDARDDLAALEAARPLLLRRSAYRWPRIGFSLAENRADLARHASEHAAGVAFTYTVFERRAGRCVGCVYLRPLQGTLRRLARHADNPDDRTTLASAAEHLAGPDGAAHASDLTLWTTPDLAGDGRDRALLQALRDWLARDFGFEAVWLVANDGEARVARMAEALRVPHALAARSDERRWRFWSLLDAE